MNRRRFLGFLAGAPLAACASPPLPDRDYQRCLLDHLRALAARALSIRSRALSALTTREVIAERQAWVRDTLFRITGGELERTPLGTRVLGGFERAGYRLEKLVYESRPGLHVTANLYVPTGRRGPFPGVLFQSGHLPEGKGAAPYQSACQALAKRGHVVLAFDPAGQGERVYSSRPGSSDDEHDRTGEQLLLAGDTQTRLMLWDAVRSLDVLASHPEVDPRRLASAGHSGGGTLTMLLAAVDDRLAAAAVSCANTGNVAVNGFDPAGAVDDAEQNLLGSGPLGLDRWDLLQPFAPKPLLLLVSTEDHLTTYARSYLVSGREELTHLRGVYATLGAPESLRWVESEDPHGLTRERRVEIERWFGRFLLDEATADDEPVVAPEREEVTWVVPGGNVVRALGGRTPRDLAREQVAGGATGRVAEMAEVERLLHVTRPRPGLGVTVLESSLSQGVEVDTAEVQSAPSVWIPAWLFNPRGTPRSVTIALEPEGRSPWHALAREGHAVWAADVRGVGAQRPELAGGASSYAREHPAEQSFAWASLILGESLLAQRINDILSLVEAVSNDPFFAASPLAVAARGELTLPALFAAALDSRIDLLHLDGGLASYRSVLDAEDPRCPLAGILPGLLAHTDLPGLAAASSPCAVILTGPLDGSGRSMPLSEARTLYRGAPDVRITAERAWGPEALAGALSTIMARTSRV